jgi:hypothetical protein
MMGKFNLNDLSLFLPADQLVPTGEFPCLDSNRVIVYGLENVQLFMAIYLSPVFAEALAVFIDQLEGEIRPFQLVPADFLIYSIERTLKRFFQTVSEDPGPAIVGLPPGIPDLTANCGPALTGLPGTLIIPDLPDLPAVSSPLSRSISIAGPKGCAEFLKALFYKLSYDLGTPSVLDMDIQRYRFLIRSNAAAGLTSRTKLEKATKTVGAAATVKGLSSAGVREPTTAAPCIDHQAGLAGVRDPRTGSTITCTRGRQCRFSHATEVEPKHAADLATKTLARYPPSPFEPAVKRLKREPVTRAETKASTKSA